MLNRVARPLVGALVGGGMRNVLFQGIRREFVLHNTKRLHTKPRILEKEIPLINPKVFADKAVSKMVSLEFAFTEYQKLEPRVVKVDSYKDDNGIDDILYVEIKDYGGYIFKTNRQEQFIQMQSPKSGLWKYYYAEANNRWECNKDNHLIDELLLREVLKFCNGGFNPS
jgi:frataxin-like iron-binding protein CyaY